MATIDIAMESTSQEILNKLNEQANSNNSNSSVKILTIDNPTIFKISEQLEGTYYSVSFSSAWVDDYGIWASYSVKNKATADSFEVFAKCTLDGEYVGTINLKSAYGSSSYYTLASLASAAVLKNTGRYMALIFQGSYNTAGYYPSQLRIFDKETFTLSTLKTSATASIPYISHSLLYVTEDKQIFSISSEGYVGKYDSTFLTVTQLTANYSKYFSSHSSSYFIKIAQNSIIEKNGFLYIGDYVRINISDNQVEYLNSLVSYANYFLDSNNYVVDSNNNIYTIINNGNNFYKINADDNIVKKYLNRCWGVNDTDYLLGEPTIYQLCIVNDQIICNTSNGGYIYDLDLNFIKKIPYLGTINSIGKAYLWVDSSSQVIINELANYL